MLIREVILENFMSYEYARVPLRRGVNVVVGPNGSGKSSFLVGICVALGDTYTERSKKLSDLIRWGQEKARVSLFLDNSVRESGQRPIPRFDNDVIRLTRNLKRDGRYWFEIDQKIAQKYEVVDILKGLGFDPENMLIIMHQNMPTQFAALSPQEKLSTLEKAVGFETYRTDVLEAKKKLHGILSEEESLIRLLQKARETLTHWREQYERLQEKRHYQTRLIFLQKEIAWNRVLHLENNLKKLESELEKAKQNLHKAETDIEQKIKFVSEVRSKLNTHQIDLFELFEKRIEHEKTIGICEYNIGIGKERLAEIKSLMKSSNEQRRKFEIGAKELKASLKSGPTTLDDYFVLLDKFEEAQSEAYDYWQENLVDQMSGFESSIENFSNKLSETELSLNHVISEIADIRSVIEESYEKYIETRIQVALLKDQRGRLKKRIEELKADSDKLQEELNDAEAEALIKGSRVETGRISDEILNEIRKISGILMGLATVSDEAEYMYESYSRTFNELQNKVEIVRESRLQVMKEIDERSRRWMEVMKNLLTEINTHYQSLLSMLQATGEVKLTNSFDIEEAGLEIWVGFKGALPSRLDPYVHSGGERSTSIMAFLLSLQQNVLSPFRAVDEFDLHMDPKNKEVVSGFIVETLKGSKDQYMAITPSNVTFKGDSIHLIIVHKTEGKSTVKVVA